MLARSHSLMLFCGLRAVSLVLLERSGAYFSYLLSMVYAWSDGHPSGSSTGAPELGLMRALKFLAMGALAKFVFEDDGSQSALSP